MFVVHTFLYGTGRAICSTYNLRMHVFTLLARQETLILTPQHDSTAMAASMSTAIVQGFRKGGLVDRRFTNLLSMS